MLASCTVSISYTWFTKETFFPVISEFITMLPFPAFSINTSESTSILPNDIESAVLEFVIVNTPPFIVAFTKFILALVFVILVFAPLKTILSDVSIPNIPEF